MIIAVGNRDSTQDIDTFFLPDFVAISQAATIVAEREGLPIGWLDSTAAGFTYGFIRQPPMRLWKKFPGLHVYTPGLDYLFVTKIMASRPKDDADIVALAKKLHLSKQKDVLALVRKYVSQEQISDEVLDTVEEHFEP